MSKKLLDYAGLQNFLNRLKGIIPTKTSELQNDSGFITSEGAYDSELSLESEKAVQNKVVTAAINSKQNSLSSGQLDAANSGVTAAKVQDYDSHLSDTDIHVTAADKASWDSKAAGTHTHTASDVSGLSTVATSGSYNDLSNKPSIPSKTSDLTNDSGFLTSHNPVDSALSSTSTNAVQNKVINTELGKKANSADLAAVATSGSYNDLSNKPTIPTVNNATLTIQKNGTTVNTFTANSSSNVTANITVPVNVSELTNDSGYLTSSSNLDSSKLTGTIDIARLPKGALERLVTVADQTARFALTENDVQLGDTVKQLDTGVMYIVSDESKLNSEDGYTEYTAGSATSVPWSGVQDKPSAFTPASHTHGSITNDGKLGTASRALITDSSKKIAVSSVTSTELGYLSGVTSAIQTQLNGKSNTGHTHTASEVSGLATVATSGSYNDLSNKPSIPSKTSDLTNDSGFLTSHNPVDSALSSTSTNAVQNKVVKAELDNKSDTGHTHTKSEITDFPTLSTVATSGSYNDLTNKPTIPTVYNKTLTIQQNGTTVKTFTANSNADVTANITVPTKTSDLTNDSGFLTAHQSLADYSTKADTIKDLSISGKVITYTKGDDTTGTLTTQDTVYTHPTSAGNKHIPSGGSANQYLKYSASGTAQWATIKTSELNNDSGFLTSHNPVDSALSTTSENAVQNKVVKAELDNKANSADLSTVATTGSYTDLNNIPSNFTPASHTHGSITNDGKLGTASRALITDGNKKIAVSSVTSTELGYLSGVTSAVQDQLDAKAASTHSHTASEVSGLATVATSGSYNDLANKPTIPTVNNATLTIQKNGTTVKTFTANASSNVTANITVPTKVSELTNDSGFLTSHNPVDSTLSDTSTNAVQNKVVKGALDGKSDTGHTHTKSEITDFPTLATVATSGSYNDLTNKPTIPTVNNATLTIQKNGTTVKTFTANASSNVTANITVPTKVSELTNDSGFLTSASSLDSSKLTGTIDIARLPKGALERLVTVADQTARFALTTSDVQLGDTVKQLDTGVMYIVTDESKLSSADGYTEYTAGAATSVPWSGVTGKPSSYTPASHSHGNIANGGTLGTASRALITDGNKKITTSSVTSTELGYVSGVTSAIQTQLNGKAASSHTHTASEVSGLSTVATSGSYNDLSNKPTIDSALSSTSTNAVQNKVINTALAGKAASSHTHTKSQITDFPTKTSQFTNDSHQTITVGTDTTSTASPAHSGTFTCIDSVTRDSNGHVTAVNTKTVTLPSDNNTDTLVTQNVSTANENHPVLLTVTKDATANQGAKTSIFASGVKVNPSTNTVTATTFSGALSGNASSATQFSANKDVTLTGDVTGTASSKAGWSVATTLSDSGVTAGTYGPSADVTGNNNATISVPEITVDSKGRVTSVANRTLTCKNNTYNVYNKTLTIQKNGTNVATFTSNSNTDVTANITVPTKTSELTNDSGYLTSHQSLSNYVTLNSAQTITGAKTFQSGGTSIGIKATNHEKGVVPSGNQHNIIQFTDKNGVQTGFITKLKTSGYSCIQISSSDLYKNSAMASDGTDVSATFTVGTSTKGVSYWQAPMGAWESVYPHSERTAITLGTSTNRWNAIYANSYYLGTTAFGDIVTLNKYNRISKGDIEYSGSTAQGLVPTISTLAFWNGAYSGTTSNLAYCAKGAFGDVVTHNASEFLTSHQSLANYSTLANTIKSLSISGKTITYTKGDNTTGTLTTQDTNTDTLMTQNVSTANNKYPILLCPTAEATANQGAKTGIFGANALINPSTGEIISKSNGTGAFRVVGGNYGFFVRNDGSNTYFLMTASGDQYGTWTSARPLTISDSTGVCSINGNAATANKLTTARNIALGNEFIGSANFDGSGNITINGSAYLSVVGVGNKNNYPYHRFAYFGPITTQYTDAAIRLQVARQCINGGSGILEIEFRTNATNGDGQCDVRWIVRSSKLPVDCIQIGFFKTWGGIYADVFCKSSGAYDSYVIRSMGDGSRGSYERKFTLQDCSEANNTTTSDPLTSVNSYASIAAAGTALHNQAYTDILTATDAGVVETANTCSGNSATASKVVATVANDTTGTLVQGTMGSNDCFRIAIGGASNAGWAEIATGDDYNEPIYVRQYQGSFATLKRTATLLDASGNTAFPGTVTATGFSGPLTGNVTGNCSGSSGSCTGNAATATQFSANTTVALTGDATGTSAGSKKGWSVPVTLANSGVTAGSYGPTADVTGNNNATISVPQITVDAKGRVTSVTNRTLTCKNNTYTVNNATLTIQKNGTNVATFTSNASANATANITVPTKTSELTNDSGYLTSHQSLSNYVTLNSAQTISGNKTFTGTLTGTLTGNCSGTSGGLLTNTTFANRSFTYTEGSVAIGTTAGKAFKGSSNNAALVSFPENGTASNDTSANIQNLRFTWQSDGKYLHDLFTSPNSRYFWHRDVNNASARPWRRIVEENTTDVTPPTWDISIGGNSATATKATGNANGKELTNTIIKGLSVSGKTITYTQIDGTTGTLTTQDTNTDTLMTQNVSTTNATYPVLLVATADATANQGAKTGIFAKSVKVNPSTNVISASGFSGPLTGNVTGNCSGSSGSCTGNAATATQFSANTTVALTGDATGTSAGSKKGWSVPVTLANSGVTAGTYGPSADVTGDNNATISVPEITVDAKGRVTSVVNRTLTCKNNTYSVYNKTLTIQKNGSNVATFTSNSNTNVTANITVPTKTSELTNDSGYLTSHQSLSNYVTLNGAQTISGNKTFTGNVILNEAQLVWKKNLTADYEMTASDFVNQIGFVKVATFKAGTSSAPRGNNGDYDILSLSSNTAYGTFLCTTPRNDILWYGKFWESAWQGWKEVVNCESDQTISGAKTFTGNVIGINKDNSTEDANSLYSTTAGSKLTYYTTTNGGTKLTNVPAAVNTTLESRTIRRLSDSDWVVDQICHNSNGLYYRKGSNGTWSAWKTFAFTDSSITGTAANVTGTVAIANGGTGATSRLNAVKNLTNENVGTGTNYFLTITSNWGKAGYCSVADAKTVLGLGSAAYTASTAYAAASHTHTKSQITDFPTKVSAFTNDSRFTTCLSSGNAINFDWSTQYSNKVGIKVDNTWVGGILTTTNTTIPTKTSQLTNDSGFLTSHQSLSNYVTLNGTQTITGAKTYSSDAKFVLSGTRGTAPSATTHRRPVDMVDSAGNRVFLLTTAYNANMSSMTELMAYNTTVASGNSIGSIGIGCDSSGNCYTKAPTPATTDNSTKIATTAFVNSFGNSKYALNENFGKGTTTWLYINASDFPNGSGSSASIQYNNAVDGTKLYVWYSVCNSSEILDIHPTATKVSTTTGQVWRYLGVTVTAGGLGHSGAAPTGILGLFRRES